FVNDESVLLVQWLVKDGEKVEKGDSLVTIETSKATMDIEAPASGYVRFDIPKGTEVKVGGVLCYVTDNPTDPLPQTSGKTKTDSQLHERPAQVATVSATTRFSSQASALLREHGLTEDQF